MIIYNILYIMISSKNIVDRNKNILQLYKQKYNNKKNIFYKQTAQNYD